MRHRKRGGIILMVLIFTVIIAVMLASVFSLVTSEHRGAIRSLGRESAFHIAESGIEITMCALRNGVLVGEEWSANESGSVYYYVKDGIYLGNQTGALQVALEDLGGSDFMVTCLGEVRSGRLTVQRAVQTEVYVEKAGEAAQQGDPTYHYGIVSRYSMKLNHSNPGMFAASYDSYNNCGIPVREINTGYDITLATPNAADDAINLNNSYIQGSVRSGGGRIAYDDNPNAGVDQMATVVGEESGLSNGVDPNMLTNDFDGTIKSVSLPDTSDYTQVEYDQNFWQNKDCISIGEPGVKTYISTENLNFNGSLLTVNGDVVLHVNRTINLQGDIGVMNGSHLTLAAGENIQLNGNTTHQHPSQLELLSLAGKDVVVHSELWTGTINAPDSNVRLHGNAQPVRNSEFRGAVVAGNFEATNGFTFYYDISLKFGSGDESPSDVSSGGVVTIKSWSEIPPESCQDLFF